MKLNLHNSNTGIKLSLESDNDLPINVFELIGRIVNDQLPETKTMGSTIANAKSVESKLNPNVVKPLTVVDTDVKSVKPDLIGSERTLNIPISSAFKKKFDETIDDADSEDFGKALEEFDARKKQAHTASAYIRTKPRADVKVKVECPTCTGKGIQHTQRGNRYTWCNKCNEKLFLRPAGAAWEELDADGNEYHASTVYVERTTYQ